MSLCCCVVPPRHEANVKVHVVYDNLSCPATEWAVEPRTNSSGVIAARTLFSGENLTAVVRVLNYSNRSYVLKEDSFLSSAEPVSVVSESESANGAEQCVHGNSVECQQCVYSDQLGNPWDHNSDRLSDSVVTKSDTERSRSLDRESLDTASDSVSPRTTQSASDLSSGRCSVSDRAVSDRTSERVK